MHTDQRAPEHRSRINLNNAYELRYWTIELGASEQQLKDVVRRVGPDLADVRRELSQEIPPTKR